MTDHIREFASIVDCPEIQALRGEWEHDDLMFIVLNDSTVMASYATVASDYRKDELLRTAIWLPPVSSLSHPERSMVGALGDVFVGTIRLCDYGDFFLCWQTTIQVGDRIKSCTGPILEIAMAKALKWWLTEGKK